MIKTVLLASALTLATFTGVNHAYPELGKKLLEIKTDFAVKQIKEEIASGK